MSSKPTKVVVLGALGRAGRATVDILCEESDIEVVGVADLRFKEDRFVLPGEKGTVPSSPNLDPILETSHPDVLVDFTDPGSTMAAVRSATARGVHMVIGTTGLTEDQMNEIDRLAKRSGVGALTGTLSLGVALTAHLASIAAKYFDYGEIVDLGKLEKQDAPSGAALDIAKAMTKARGRPFELPQGQSGTQACRGGRYEGVTVHSLRLADCYIHQQVLLSTKAGTLMTIGLELTSAEYLRPGIVIAVRESVKQRGLVYGLEDIFLRVNGVSGQREDSTGGES